MRKHPGFTLVEMLVGMVVLLAVVVTCSWVSRSVLETVQTTSEQLASKGEVSSALNMMRRELTGLTVSEQGGHYLNLRIREEENGVAIYFSRSLPVVLDLEHMGFVQHVGYLHDNEESTLHRVEFHSSQSPDFVKNTAGSTQNIDHSLNISRLRRLSPAYQGEDPYFWIDSEPLFNAVNQTKETPLLRNLKRFEVRSYSSPPFEEGLGQLNEWNSPSQLPLGIRLNFEFPIQSGAGAARVMSALIQLPSAPGN